MAGHEPIRRVDGYARFSRSGPWLIDSVEMPD